VGCLEAATDVRLIETLDGARSLTRLSSREPLLILPGDRFVLRNLESTIAGGRVLDPFPPIRVNRQKTSSRLRGLLTGSDSTRLRLLVEESTQGKKISNLVRLTGWTPAKIRQLAAADEALTLCEVEKRVISLVWLEQKRQQVVAWLKNFHKTNPTGKAASIHQVRSSLMSGVEPTLCDLILAGIPEIAIAGEGISLADHVAKMGLQEPPIRKKPESSLRKHSSISSLEEDSRQVGKAAPKSHSRFFDPRPTV
jgi:hypothetical protein